MGKEENLPVNIILRYLNKRYDCYCWRNNNRPIFNRPFLGEKGLGDIVGTFRGKFLSIEVKTPTGKLREEQKNFIARVNNMGGIAFSAKTLEDVIKVLGVENAL